MQCNNFNKHKAKAKKNLSHLILNACQIGIPASHQSQLKPKIQKKKLPINKKDATTYGFSGSILDKVSNESITDDFPDDKIEQCAASEAYLYNYPSAFNYDIKAPRYSNQECVLNLPVLNNKKYSQPDPQAIHYKHATYKVSVTSVPN